PHCGTPSVTARVPRARGTPGTRRDRTTTWMGTTVRRPRFMTAHGRQRTAAHGQRGEAVQAVLAASGLRVHQRRTLVAGLTAREVQILVLLARPLPNKQIARELSI